ncbi:TadE/TadG family type IV pilus assembly protein [Variovorax sp. Root473]|uniref:TadE/TadG family type IV pilus assembly protein n=1 Tax=Variovorax sp. Root473 TaxID=1736541 RepID=UPI0006F4A960|nr:TadE family protein [Variovorax sp. Root473]KQX88973.1 hypothetical protein ASD34_07895 [Variovorax sp. Root473]
MSILNTRPRLSPNTGRRQRGIAAIEFALVFLLLFIAMYGVATFGAIFYTQQAISRAAEDGARAAMLMPQPLASGSVCQAVSDSLASSLIPPFTCPSSTSSLTSVSLTGCSPGGTSCAVTVIYQYKDNPILPPVSLFDISWVPDVLQSSATVALKAS